MYMVELEQLTEFRFYKLKPQWQKRCTTVFETNYGSTICNGFLWMFRTQGSIKLRCNHVGCTTEYLVPKFCSNCDREYKFDDLTCDNCEPIVRQLAQYYITIEESGKSIKKINKHYKAGDMSEKDWKNALELNKTENESCSRRLKELKEKHPVIERHLQTLIKQP